jgi:CHAT domain-containing protein
LEEEKKVRRKLVLHYVRPSKSLSVTIEDERGHRLFGDDSPRQMDIDVHSFGLRADDAWRSPQWRDLIKGIGQDLYAKLFTDHSIVVEAYHRAMGMVDNQDEALSLVFSSTRDTLRLPVEFLHDGHEYLCLRHPVSRYLQGLHSRPPLSYKATSGQRLRFLLVASDTGGISNVDREVATLRKDLYNLLSAKGIDRNIVALSTSAASHKRVVQELENKGHDVWHYAGHGLYDKDSPERSALVFWEKTNRKGDRCFLLASDLCDLTRNTSFSLVYLSCCLGTTAGDIEHLYQDDFLGLADALAEAKVPTVIGFRWPVSDDGAVAIARTFYKALCKEDFNPRRALWQARRTVTHGPQKRDDPTWASPVLIEQS